MRAARTSYALAVAALLGSVLASVARAAGPLPRDVVVTDVTASGFTVTWNAEPGTGTVSVFRDVLGTTPAATVVEPQLVLGGDPAVAQAAATLGVARVRVGGLQPGQPYFFRTATTPLAGGAALLVPAPGAALPSVVTALESFAYSANGLGAPVVRAAGGVLVPGALLRVRVAGSLSPLAALAGDGYAGAGGTVDLANLHTAAGVPFPTAGGEAVTVEAIAGTAGRARVATTLAANQSLGGLQMLAALAVAVPADVDGDQLPDDWETENGVADPVSDQDGDGLSALDEYRLGTDPKVADTDGDGLGDGNEVNVRGTIPTIADTDRDGRPDGAEVNGPTPSNPRDADSDDDGVDDGTEITAGTDPTDGSDFPVLDADGDGVSDALDRCPTVPDPAQTDIDGDGAGDACDPDDDGDGVPDGTDLCPRTVDVAQTDGDADGVGDTCDNCPALANTDQANHDADGLGDACDPDSDDDGVPDFGPPAAPSNRPVIFTGLTSVVDSSVPPVANAQAFIGIAKMLPADRRLVPLGFFDLLNRTLLAVPVAPADATAPGWLAVQADTSDCNCFPLAGTETITLATDAGTVVVHLPAGAEQLGRVIFVATDGSTYNTTAVASGILSTLLRSSQLPAPLDNCRFVPNPSQTDTDGDGLGDACDPSTVTTTTTSVTTTTRVRGSTTTTTLADGKALFLYVANYDPGSIDNRISTVMRYDAFTGEPRGVRGDAEDAMLVPSRRPGAFLGGTRFVGRGTENTIYASGGITTPQRFDATTGANLGRNGNPLNATLRAANVPGQPQQAMLGPFGFLYDLTLDAILRLHPESGELVSTFVDLPSLGGSISSTAVTTGPDGHVYVARFRYVGFNDVEGEVVRFDGGTGAPLPAPGESGARFASGLKIPTDLAFAPDGTLWVASWNQYNANQSAVYAFDGTSGASFGALVPPNPAVNGGLKQPRGLAFGPDGNLYVSSEESGAILRYDGFTGALLDTFVPKGRGGLTGPWGLLFMAADEPPPTTATTSTTMQPSTTTTSTVTPTTSTTTTTLPRCGNGVLDGGEDCDGGVPACGAGSACGAPGTAGACLCVPAGARTFVVNSTLVDADATPGNGVCETATGNGVCTLRAAVQETNALAGPDLVLLPPGRHPVPTQPVEIDFVTDRFGLVVTGDLVITGMDATRTIIDGQGAARVLTVLPGATVTVRGVTAAHGQQFINPSGQGGAGGIHNRGTLTVVDAIVRDNYGAGAGGLGNDTGATLTVVRTLVSHNFFQSANPPAYIGAGLTNRGTATIVDSVFRHNVGTAIGSLGVLHLERCAVVQNRGDVAAAAIAGLYTDVGSTTTIANSTISENVGAGIHARGALDVASSTIYRNVAYAPAGGGAGIVLDGITGTPVTMRNTIVAGNDDFSYSSSLGADCKGPSSLPITSQGHNLIQRQNCTITGDRTGDIVGQDPLLAPLARRSGTWTNALLASSPARDAGSPDAAGVTGACEPTDQRGIERPQPAAGRCDIGAFEDDGTPPPPSAGTVDIVVDDTGAAPDAAPGDHVCATAGGKCTLAAAIEEANRVDAPVVIHLPAATFAFRGGPDNDTYAFTNGPYDDPYEGPSALPHVTGDVTIAGQGPEATILRRATNDYRFRLLLGFTGRVVLRDLTAEAFEAPNAPPRLGASTKSTVGAVYAIAAPLRLENVLVRDVRSGDGAVTVSFAPLVLRRTSFVRGRQSALGGAAGSLAVHYGGIDAEDCVVTDGAGSASGGAYLQLAAPSRIARCTFEGNSGSYSGGIYVTNVNNRDSTPILAIEDSVFESNTSNVGDGGAVLALSSLDVRGSRFVGNQADSSGGAIMAWLDLFVADSHFSENLSARGPGGAIDLNQGGKSVVTESTFARNGANGNGGAIHTGNSTGGGTLALTGVTVNDNFSFANGGGLAIEGLATASLVNTTVTGNAASGDGGGINLFYGIAELASVTVASNVAGGKGGGTNGAPGSVLMRNTLIAGNEDDGTAPDCSGQGVQSYGYNLIGTTHGCYYVRRSDFQPLPEVGDTFGPADGTPIDARVAPLGDNGGPTETRALTLDSRAVDAANPAGCTDTQGALLATDQRGTPRAQDGNGDQEARCDIGAFEGTSGVIVTTTTSTTTSTTYPYFPGDPVPDDSTTTTLPPLTTTTVPASTSTTTTSTSTTSTTGTGTPSTTTTSTTSTTGTATSSTLATSTTSTSTTTSTTPGVAEICGNCLDDDGDGRVDFEDPACCGVARPQALTLKKAVLRPAGTLTKLRLKGNLGSVALGTFPPVTKDLTLQLRPEAGGEALCARIPAATLVGKRKAVKFKDKRGTVANAKGLTQVKLRIRKDGTVLLTAKGKQVAFPTPSGGRLRATIAFRDPAAAEGGNQCRAAVAPLRSVGKKGALRFP